MPAGPHVVQFTLQTGALGILAVGTPPAATDGSLFPTVLASDIPNENQATPRDPESITALFSADIKANVALLAADGLDVRLVPTRSFMLGAPDAMADATHPNALGHTQLAAAFDASLPAVSPVNITMFQPNLPIAAFVLPTTGARSLTAIYSGDSVYSPALSEPFVIDVQDGTTSTQLVTLLPERSLPKRRHAHRDRLPRHRGRLRLVLRQRNPADHRGRRPRRRQHKPDPRDRPLDPYRHLQPCRRQSPFHQHTDRPHRRRTAPHLQLQRPAARPGPGPAPAPSPPCLPLILPPVR